MRIAKVLGSILGLLWAVAVQAVQVNVYTLNTHEWEDGRTLVFTSISGCYPICDDSDRQTLPDELAEMSQEEAEYFTLSPAMRKRFMEVTKLHETDSVFVYDYCNDQLMSWKAKELKVIAAVSIYVGKNDWPYSPWDYQVGFEFPREKLKEFEPDFQHTFMAIGKRNPFVRGQMKPLVWKEVPKSKATPDSIAVSDHRNWGTYGAGREYECVMDGMRFLVTELNQNAQISGLQVVVTEAKSARFLCKRYFLDHESASPAPLNGRYPGENMAQLQWAGRLFRGEPPIMLGFSYVSFGCPGITFLAPNREDQWIECDNRH